MEIKEFVDTITRTSETFPASIFDQTGKVYTCVNPYSYHIVKANPEVYRRMDGLLVDGMLMCKLINRLWHRNIPRLSFDMAGMAPALFSRLNAPDSSETIYFIGARQEAIEGTVAQIRNTYPNMKIAGYRNGYFYSPEERKDVIDEIVRLKPDFTLVGMGSPLQENFIADLRDSGYKGIGFTCGGFLHQTAQRMNYYPDWINKYNLRAFYRLYKEKGLFKRLYNVLIQFPVLFTIDTIKAH